MALVATYNRTSAANYGEPVTTGLARLRSFAESRGDEVVLELHDHAPRRSGPWPGRQRLSEAVRAGEVEVVYVERLHCVVRSLNDMVITLGAWHAAGAAIIVTDEALDTSDPRDPSRQAIALLASVQSAILSESQRIAAVRARTAPSSRAWGGPRAIVNLLELLDLLHQGMSNREIQAELRRRGAPLGYGTIATAVRSLKEAGRVDQARRRQALAKRRDRHRGGHPRVNVRYDLSELAALYHGGVPYNQIFRNCTTLSRNATIGSLRRVLRELEAAGSLDPAIRKAAIEAQNAAPSRSGRQ